MLILASQSPRRREILTNAGIPFTVRVTGVPEEHREGESPAEYVRRLALAKAEAALRGEGEIVLGADTVVVIDGAILEKPASQGEGMEMLRRLSGRNHTVVTGVALLHSGGAIQEHCETTVHFAPLDADEIEEYVVSGEPADKAGGYAIQGLASKFIDRIEGDYFNVVGLPIALVYRLAKQAGLRLG